MKRIGVLAAGLISVGAAADRPMDCAALARLALPETTVQSAVEVPAGAKLSGAPAAASDRPAFCRVSATRAPSVKFEVWLPVRAWNGRFQMLGGGGTAGYLDYGGMSRALKAGYATAATDTGHVAGDVRWLGDAKLLKDYHEDAVHDVAVRAKAVIAAAYGAQPTKSFFNSCSNGGRQALMEAQRHPADFDGVIAGAPANHWTRTMPELFWPAHVAGADGDTILTPEVLATAHRRVIAKCDALDGVRDGVLEDPQACHISAADLTCKAGARTDCLTAAQATAVMRIYQGPRNPRDGARIFGGLEPGSELGWSATLTTGAGSAAGSAQETLRYALYGGDPGWSWRSFDFDKDLAKLDARFAAEANATDADLGPFVRRGGKIILYHGWADPFLSPAETIGYYRAVVQRLGPEASDSVRLFMAPGMGHCGGGEGADSFDMMPALDAWASGGPPPARIEAARIVDGRTIRTRPLCPYPQVASWKGAGSTDTAANFACRAPRRP